MSAPPSTIYQFQISLRGPKVWRTVQVPGTYNFWDLHTVIQDCFGWQNAHLHKFEIEELLIGPPDEYFKPIPELTAKISDYFKSAGDSAYYEYDFGFSWEHDIVLEKILPAIEGMQYPKCIAGEMASLPEDCCESDEEDDFDQTFDPKLVKFDNSKERLKWDVCY